MIKGMDFARKMITGSEAFNEVVAKEVAPGSYADTQEGLERYLKTGLVTAFHPVGTAAMIKMEEGGVVDERLRVYGVDGLRIVCVVFFMYHVWVWDY